MIHIHQLTSSPFPRQPLSKYAGQIPPALTDCTSLVYSARELFLFLPVNFTPHVKPNLIMLASILIEGELFTFYWSFLTVTDGSTFKYSLQETNSTSQKCQCWSEGDVTAVVGDKNWRLWVNLCSLNRRESGIKKKDGSTLSKASCPESQIGGSTFVGVSVRLWNVSCETECKCFVWPISLTSTFTN